MKISPMKRKRREKMKRAHLLRKVLRRRRREKD